jgi:hypothetical protein
MHKTIVAIGLAGLLSTGCGGPYTVEEENIEDGMVTGSETVEMDDGQEKVLDQEGDVPETPYQKALEDDENLGPNAPGYLPPLPD